MKTLRRGNSLRIFGVRYYMVLTKEQGGKFLVELYETEGMTLRLSLTAKNYRVMLGHFFKLKRHLK